VKIALAGVASFGGVRMASTAALRATSEKDKLAVQTKSEIYTCTAGVNLALS
jgi:hypothetical protein